MTATLRESPPQQASLIKIPTAPLPEGSTVAFVTARDGTRLRVAVWMPSNARSSVIVLPGATEYIELYGETIGELLARGNAVGILDWRGQGLSTRPLKDPRRRHIDNFRTYVDDFRLIAETIYARLPKPWILVCQSMGGNIGARILAERAPGIAAAVLLAPMLAVNTGAWPLPAARVVARASCTLGLSSRYVPGGSGTSAFAVPFEANTLTHDPRRFAWLSAYPAAEPALDIGSPTIGWLQAAFESMDQLARPAIARRISCPVLLVMAEEDLVVRNGAIEGFSKLLPNGRLLKLSNARHDILLEGELVREAFWREYDAFVADLPVATL